jgi:hypothetical protein
MHRRDGVALVSKETTMKESDYVLASDMGRVQSLDALLREIVPGMPHGAIPKDEHVRVVRLVMLWRQRLYCKLDPGDAKAKRELAQWEQDFAEDKGSRP